MASAICMVATPAGHRTITFKVFRQTEELEECLATETVRVSQSALRISDGMSLDLKPTRATLQSGGSIGSDICIYD